MAIVGINDATETGEALPRTHGRTALAGFDAQYSEGADCLIVPAMSRDDDPAVLASLNGRAAKGARIVGVCAGAKVVGAAGLLDSRRGRTYWSFVEERRKNHPAMRDGDRRLRRDAARIFRGRDEAVAF